MKRIKAWVVLGMWALSGMVQADNPQGESAPKPGLQAEKDGFGAMLLLTPDRDWEEKWNTPAEYAPHFNTTDMVGVGGELTVLVMLQNPKVDPKSGMTDVVCDFVMRRPAGHGEVVHKDLPCFKAKLTTDPQNVYLASAWLKYIEEPADARGTWTVDVRVRDRLRGVELPLHASFVVQGKMARRQR